MSYFRPELETLPAYVPGRMTSDPHVYKVSSNEVPYGPLPGVIEAMSETLAGVNRYPDMTASALCADIAAHHGLTPDRVVASCGSVQMIEKILAAAAVPGSEVVASSLSFEAYPIAITAAGATRIAVPTIDGGHDLDAMAGAVSEATAAILVCSPNNPTGHAISHTELVRFLDRVGDHLVILDEAYIDFVTMDDPIRSLDLLQTYPNLVVLRTFSKAHGLAALRVGYALTSADNAATIRSVATPFAISTPAQAAARASLALRDELRSRVATVTRARDSVLRALTEMGVEVPASQANFVWFPGADPEVFTRAGLVVRALPGGVRVTIAEEEANARILRAAAELVGH